MIVKRQEARPLPTLTALEIEAVAQRVAEILAERFSATFEAAAVEVRDVALDMALSALPPVVQAPEIRTIINAVCEISGVSERQILGDQRASRFALPRMVAMYLACHHTGLTTPQIGRAMGRDHTTVLHGRDRIASLLATGEPTVTALHARALVKLGLAPFRSIMEAAE